tara:strand:- start:1308 stop:3296 length:1989 start_codon:yes stop_codon:yes gene_type:complete
MAGFSVDVGDAGTSYAQGVAAPSSAYSSPTATGLEGLGKLLSAFEPRKTSAPTQADKDKTTNAALAASLHALKGTTDDPVKLKNAVEGVVAKHTAAGNNFGDDEKAAVEAMIGVPFEIATFDAQEQALEQGMQGLQENAGQYALAVKTLAEQGNENPTDMDILTQATAYQQRMGAAGLLVAEAKALGAEAFMTQELPASMLLLDGLEKEFWSLYSVESGGGELEPQFLAQADAALLQVRGQLAQGTGVTDEMFKPVKARLDQLENILKITKSFDSNVLATTEADLQEHLTKVRLNTVNQLLDAGKTDQANMVMNLGPEYWATTAAQNYSSVAKSLNELGGSKVDREPYSIPVNAEVMSTGPEQPSSGGVDTLPTFTGEAIEHSSSLEKGAVIANVTIAAAENASLTPESVKDDTGLEIFTTNATKTASILANNGSLMKTTTIDETLTPDFFSKMKILKTDSPSVHADLKAKWKEALLTQLNISATASSGTMADSYIAVSALGELSYRFDKKKSGEGNFLSIPLNPKTAALVESYATTYYNGDMLSMFKDRGRKLDTFSRNQEGVDSFLREGSRDLSKAMGIARQTKYYSDKLKQLGVESKDLEASLVNEVPDASKDKLGFNINNPMQIVWSDETDVDELLFNGLAVGQYFTNRNGDIEQKVR